MKAIELEPSYSAAYHNRGSIYSHIGEYDKAISDLASAIETATDDSCSTCIHYHRGNAYFAKEAFKSSVADYDAALEQDSSLLDAYLKKAQAYEKLGRIDEAIKAYESFIKYTSPPHKLSISDSDRELVEQKMRELRD